MKSTENQTRTICRACGFVQGSVPNMKYCERRDPRDPDGKDAHEFYMSPEQPLSGDQGRKAPAFTRSEYRKNHDNVLHALETHGRVVILDDTDGLPYLTLSRQSEPFDDTEALRAEVEKLRADLDAMTFSRDAAEMREQCATLALDAIAEGDPSVQCLVARPGEGTKECAVESVCVACRASSTVEKLRAELTKIATETAHTYGHSEECEATLCPDDCGCDDAGPHRDCECSTGVMNAAHMLARRALGYPDGVPWEASAEQRHGSARGQSK